MIVCNAKKERYQLLLAVMLFFAACSTQDHHRTLSFFFDGVPNHEDVKLINVADSVQASNIDSSTFVAQEVKPELFIHHPYKEKKCATCHNKGSMGSLNESQPELCYRCHNSLEGQYIFEHGPLVGGYCTMCHNPHRAKEEKLLLRTEQDLCLHCHSVGQLIESVFHDSEDETDCNTCHDPHGSDNHSLLQQGVCYRCHDNFTEKYAVVHGPVAGGLCSVCHTSHREGQDKLLVYVGRGICFHCHDAGRLLKSEPHAYIEDINCIECHNPHGGYDKYMFE